MSPGQIWTLYRHELRSALRERSIVVFSIVVPLVMYPALLWAVFAGIAFVQGQTERLGTRVALLDLPPAHGALVDSLEAVGGIELTVWSGTREDALRAVAERRLDAVVELRSPAPGGSAVPDNFRVILGYSEASDRSRSAMARADSAIAGYRRGWIEEARTELEVSDRAWTDFLVVRDDATSPDEATRFLLGSVVPPLMLIIIAVAAFYPAIDATAGERERSTWETLMTVAAPRANVAAAKYLYVATFGAVGGLLNLAALTLSLQWILAPVAGDASAEMAGGGISPGFFAVIAAGTALLGLFVAAGMLVFAVFARNFKEGQSMIMPFYLAILLPVLFLPAPDTELELSTALLPLVNVLMLIRDAILGTFAPVEGAVTLVSMSACVALSILFAQWVMRREEVLLGSAEGGLGNFLGRRLRERGRRK